MKNQDKTNYDNLKIIHIRPRDVFKINDRFETKINFFIPETTGLGSINAIESLLLIKLMRIVDASYLFEFGTHKGLTTRLLLENLPNKDISDERIYTIDLQSTSGVEFAGKDEQIAYDAIKFQIKYYQESKNQHLVKQIFGDSLGLNEHQYKEKFQFIFVDGNHKLNYLNSDTEKSFNMLAKSKSCIVWHDYRNTEYPEVTAYIDNLSRQYRIYHVENTRIAFYLSDLHIALCNQN
jgi:predicted O-methyltransferase YrrM